MCCHCPQGWTTVQCLLSFFKRKRVPTAWQLLWGGAFTMAGLLTWLTCSQYLLCGLPIVALDWQSFEFLCSLMAYQLKHDRRLLNVNSILAVRKRPSTPFKPEPARQSDLHILGAEMLHRGVRRAPNMTNDWLHNVFDCSAVCWHFTNGSECVFCRSDSSLLICRPTVHTNTGTHLHSNWSVALFSLSDQQTLWTLCIRHQFALDAAFVHEGQASSEQSISYARK